MSTAGPVPPSELPDARLRTVAALVTVRARVAVRGRGRRRVELRHYA